MKAARSTGRHGAAIEEIAEIYAEIYAEIDFDDIAQAARHLRS